MRRFVFTIAVMIALMSSAQSQPVAITIGWGKFPDVPNIAVAQQRDLWAAENLKATIVPFVTGREAFEALIGGQLDFAIIAEFPAATGVMRNLDFTIDAVLAEHVAFKVITSSLDITTLQQLRGKRIAMPLGTNMQFIIADALRDASVTADLVNASPPDMIPALLNGDVTAAVPFPNIYMSARERLGSHYGEIPLAGYRTSYLLVASGKASKTPDLSRHLLSALLQADKIVLNDPAEAQKETAAFVGGLQALAAVHRAGPIISLGPSLTMKPWI